jgi:hypothetical protein
MFRRHVADLWLRSKDELATRRALERPAQGTPRAASLVLFALHAARVRGDASGAAEFLWGRKGSTSVVQSTTTGRFDLFHQYPPLIVRPPGVALPESGLLIGSDVSFANAKTAFYCNAFECAFVPRCSGTVKVSVTTCPGKTLWLASTNSILTL